MTFAGKEVQETQRGQIILPARPYQEGRCEPGEWKSDLSAEMSQSFMIDCLLRSPGIYARVERMCR